ncbi:hypothetical protein [Uliginosibacterium sediminicola]|uniref:DNA polymerase III beta sliding clamp central domain-containing protein n=1 Tax=Uliginosibacterium sediminicola TaxID=2024550 RepID=A0ABU9YW39_9RHOO
MNTTHENKEEQPIVAEFSAAMARWVSPCMPTNDIRFYLNGIHIEPLKSGGVLITATDGHRLMSAFDKEGVANRAFVVKINRESLRHCSKRESIFLTKRNKNLGTKIAVRGNSNLTVINGIGEEIFIQPGHCIIDCSSYPKWREEGRITNPPNRSDLVPAGEALVNMSYLTQFIKELPGNGITSPCVKLWRDGTSSVAPESSVVFVEFNQLPLVGIVMPRTPDTTTNFYFDRRREYPND